MAVTYLTLYLPGSNQPVQVIEGSQLHFIYAEMGASATPGTTPPTVRPDPFPYYVNEDELATAGGIGLTTVQHGADPAVARPAAASVRWIGTVQPDNMTAADLWLEIQLDPTTSIDWLGAWYADDLVAGVADGAPVTSWPDAATNTLPMTPSGPLHTQDALLVHAATAYNGQPAVAFDHSPLATPTFDAMSTPFTVALVANVDSPGGSDQVLFRNQHPGFGPSLYMGTSLSPGGPWIVDPNGPTSSTHTDAAPHLFIVTASADPLEGRLLIDDTDIRDSTGSGSPMSQLRLGVWDDNPGSAVYTLNGHIAFAAFKAGGLTDAEVASLRSWAATKYGLTT